MFIIHMFPIFNQWWSNEFFGFWWTLQTINNIHENRKWYNQRVHNICNGKSKILPKLCNNTNLCCCNTREVEMKKCDQHAAHVIMNAMSSRQTQQKVSHELWLKFVCCPKKNSEKFFKNIKKKWNFYALWGFSLRKHFCVNIGLC